MKHPATHRGCQTFRFLHRGWCITQALELIQADPGAAEFIEQADITALDGYLELTPTPAGRMRLFVVEVDQEYAPAEQYELGLTTVKRLVREHGVQRGG